VVFNVKDNNYEPINFYELDSDYHDIDLLMGHSRFGEHLGDQELFPHLTERYIKHLDQLAHHLQLRRFS
jgi:hypothetical protein